VVASKAIRREAGELLRNDMRLSTGVPPRITQYILNVSKSDWNVRFPWHRIAMIDDNVVGVILCEPDEDTRSLEVRFTQGIRARRGVRETS
jgi:hypothetical protein